MDDPEDLDDSVCQDAQKVLKLTGNRDQEALDWLRQSVGDIKTAYGILWCRARLDVTLIYHLRSKINSNRAGRVLFNCLLSLLNRTRCRTSMSNRWHSRWISVPAWPGLQRRACLGVVQQRGTAMQKQQAWFKHRRSEICCTDIHQVIWIVH